MGLGLGFAVVGVGTGDGVGPGCEGTGRGLGTGWLVAWLTGVAAGAGPTWAAVAVAVFAGAAVAAGWRGRAAYGWAPDVPSGSTRGVAAASGSTKGVGVLSVTVVVAEVCGPEMGLSWPTAPGEDAVPSRPVLAAIAPVAAESVTATAPTAASADLRFMVTSVLLLGSSAGFRELGSVGPVWRAACKGPVRNR
ncbi:MAG: hypothetical protein JWL57_2190 [Actinobacteria bacterium]|nr:hypothetical protein [Actinomycetota bacterium]